MAYELWHISYGLGSLGTPAAAPSLKAALPAVQTAALLAVPAARPQQTCASAKTIYRARLT